MEKKLQDAFNAEHMDFADAVEKGAAAGNPYWPPYEGYEDEEMPRHDFDAEERLASLSSRSSSSGSAAATTGDTSAWPSFSGKAGKDLIKAGVPMPGLSGGAELPRLGVSLQRRGGGEDQRARITQARAAIQAGYRRVHADLLDDAACTLAKAVSSTGDGDRVLLALHVSRSLSCQGGDSSAAGSFESEARMALVRWQGCFAESSTAASSADSTTTSAATTTTSKVTVCVVLPPCSHVPSEVAAFEALGRLATEGLVGCAAMTDSDLQSATATSSSSSPATASSSGGGVGGESEAAASQFRERLWGVGVNSGVWPAFVEVVGGGVNVASAIAAVAAVPGGGSGANMGQPKPVPVIARAPFGRRSYDTTDASTAGAATTDLGPLHRTIASEHEASPARILLQWALAQKRPGSSAGDGSTQSATPLAGVTMAPQEAVGERSVLGKEGVLADVGELDDDSMSALQSTIFWQETQEKLGLTAGAQTHDEL
eukprot:g573.t1